MINWIIEHWKGIVITLVIIAGIITYGMVTSEEFDEDEYLDNHPRV